MLVEIRVYFIRLRLAARFPAVLLVTQIHAAGAALGAALCLLLAVEAAHLEPVQGMVAMRLGMRQAAAEGLVMALAAMAATES